MGLLNAMARLKLRVRYPPRKRRRIRGNRGQSRPIRGVGLQHGVENVLDPPQMRGRSRATVSGDGMRTTSKNRQVSRPNPRKKPSILSERATTTPHPLWF